MFRTQNKLAPMRGSDAGSEETREITVGTPKSQVNLDDFSNWNDGDEDPDELEASPAEFRNAPAPAAGGDPTFTNANSGANKNTYAGEVGGGGEVGYIEFGALAGTRIKCAGKQMTIKQACKLFACLFCTVLVSGAIMTVVVISGIDECSGGPCVNKGVCEDGFKAFSCSCPVGFSGDFCEVDRDECMSSPCNTMQRKAKCYDGANRWECECEDGFRGDACDVIPPCNSQPCIHGGTCYDRQMSKEGRLTDSYICRCGTTERHAYRGANCEIIPPCVNGDYAPCSNHGKCYDDTESHALTAFSCSCYPGFVGDKCSNCVIGFQGAKCDENIDDCASSPCKNGQCKDSKCHDRSCQTEDQYTCTCKMGFTGATCQTDVDECASQPCQHGGICSESSNDVSVGYGKYSCLCPSRHGSRGAKHSQGPWYGYSCEIPFDECSSNPCLHGATCQDVHDGYNCICADNHYAAESISSKQLVVGTNCTGGKQCDFMDDDKAVERYNAACHGTCQKTCGNLVKWAIEKLHVKCDATLKGRNDGFAQVKCQHPGNLSVIDNREATFACICPKTCEEKDGGWLAAARYCQDDSNPLCKHPKEWFKHYKYQCVDPQEIAMGR